MSTTMRTETWTNAVTDANGRTTFVDEERPVDLEKALRNAERARARCRGHLEAAEARVDVLEVERDHLKLSLYHATHPDAALGDVVIVAGRVEVLSHL